ncbi:hypothetical protein SAMN05660199_02729 [Klenkia soli]|uniref:Uncharacterized protein n=1 Tax=Klenkia soli TaxID=1052260 RepID=A0A1H0N3L4_9ACTN|nr:hypothetical protein [Klenkia soli]SDO87222.1 hypothetical protein SAMN05660199_02729 [Klenkia soli]
MDQVESVPARVRRQRRAVLATGALAVLVVGAAGVLDPDPTTAVVVAGLMVVALGYPWVVSELPSRPRPVGRQGWRVIVTIGDMTRCAAWTPPRRASTAALGRLSWAPAGWSWEPGPAGRRLGFGPVVLPGTWEVVDRGVVRWSVLSSHVTVSGPGGTCPVTFWGRAGTVRAIEAAAGRP